jgi:hypothetical protein
VVSWLCLSAIHHAAVVNLVYSSALFLTVFPGKVWDIAFFFVRWDLRHQVLRPLLAYCTAPDDRWGWLWSIWWNEDWQGKPKYSEKTCPRAILSTTNSTWPDPCANTGRRGGKPANNRLSYGADWDIVSKMNNIPPTYSYLRTRPIIIVTTRLRLQCRHIAVQRVHEGTVILQSNGDSCMCDGVPSR